MDSNSDDDLFDFKNDNYNSESEFTASAGNISNDQHFKILREISDNFFQNLSEEKNFDLYLTWDSYQEGEPIEINLEGTEQMAGVFDIVKSDNLLMNKVIQTFAILSAEIHNILGASNFNEYDCLYPLVVYGESHEDSEKIEDGEAENQIARMLPYFVEIFEKCTKLLSLGINIVNQMIALYNKKFKNYNDSFKNIGLYKPFELLGKILSFFLTIDTLIAENENLSNHWRLYRMMFHRCKADPIKFGFTEDQARKLDKTVRRLDGSILSGKMLSSCVKHLLDNTGELNQNMVLISPALNKEFTLHFTNFIKLKIEKLNNEIGSLTETDEKIQLYHLLSVFSYYCKVYENTTDKNLFKSIWNIQKKVTNINLISHVNFSIDSYLLSLRPWDEKSNASILSSLDPSPKNIQNLKIENLQKFISTFKYLVTNLRLQTLTWITRMDSNLFKTKVTENVGKVINLRIKLIVNGLILAYQIKNSLTYCLNTHLNENLELNGELIGPICTLLELLKVIEHQFNKSKPVLALSMSMIIRVISYQIKSILEPVEKKIISNNSNIDNYKSDVYSAIKIVQSNLMAAPSRLRMIINELCFDVIKTKNFFQTFQLDDLVFNFWKLDLMQKISKEIKSVCDCSFFYWYRDLIPECLKYQVSNALDFKRIYYFAIALNDTDTPLIHVKYLEDNTILIKKYRESVFNLFNEKVGLHLAREIENDLRVQIHSILISNLNLPNPCKGEIKDLKKYLSVKTFPIFEYTFNLKNYVEDYLNRTFYDMTTLNLNDWKTYQQMRVLAHTKFNLNLHDIYLPSQTIEQGVDILFIVRNIVNFVQHYNFNLHSQCFIEVTKDNNYVTVIGVQQILNSLYTHGIGIANTIVNKTYQFLVQRLKTITQFIMDEYIKSSVMLEKRYWLDYKEKINNKYPYERAENLCNDIKNIMKTKEELTLVDKLRNFISQIGNALGFIKVIRTALMEFNGQNLKFFANQKNFEEMQNLVKSIETITGGVENILNENENSSKPTASSDPSLHNTFTSFIKTNKIFNETLDVLDQSKQSNINYLTLLVKSFENVFTNQNIPDIDLFFYLIPAVTINYVENSIIAKDKIFKKNIKDAFFTDDGFILGIAYLLKVLKQENSFDSLHWFQSVIEKLENDGKKFNSQKTGKNSNDDLLQQNMSLRKINTYKNEFELLYYTYNSAMIVFNDY
jgi:WASH complex subunit 7